SEIINGRLLALGSIFTCTKTYKLSSASISILLTSVAAVPSTFILKEEEAPPSNFILDNCNFWLLRLRILNDFVIEPAEVNTVSKVKLSVLKPNIACGLVINESFLQEHMIIPVKKRDAINFIKVINQK